MKSKKPFSPKPWVMAALFAIPAIAGLTGPHDAQAAPPPAKKEAQPVSQDYIIGPEDVLEISIWKNSDLSKTVNVRPDGKISLPLIGDIMAAGLTPTQLRDLLFAKLKEYQEAAVVSVIVQSVNSYRIFMVGEVKNPGTYVLKSNTSVLQAISMAGGFTPFASKNGIVLVRKKSDGPGEDKINIRFADLVYQEKSDKNPILKPGDTIFVP